MKKVLSLFLTFALVLVMFPIAAKADDSCPNVASISASIQGISENEFLRKGHTYKIIVMAKLQDGSTLELNDSKTFSLLAFSGGGQYLSFGQDGNYETVTANSVVDTCQSITIRFGVSKITTDVYYLINDLTGMRLDSKSGGYEDQLYGLELTQGSTKKSYIDAYWTNTDWEDVTGSCSFESANTGAVTVDSTGRISAVAPGTTTITAKYDTMSFVYKATVVDLHIGSQNGALITGTGGSATYSVTGVGVFDGMTLTTSWCDLSGNSISTPTGLSEPSTGPAMKNNSATYTVTADSTAAAGTYYFKLYINTFPKIDSNNIASVTVSADTRSIEKAITGFSIAGSTGVINESSHTIAVTVPYSTNVSNLNPTISVSAKASVSPASGTAQNFTNQVTYTVTAENGTTQNYNVTVTKAPASSAKAITGFKIGSNVGVIDEKNHKIAVTMPYGTNVLSLTPSITVSDKATVSPANGAAHNFTSPATYTVTAENLSTQDYTVTVTVAKNSAKAITGCSIGGNTGSIDETNHKISVTVPYGTDVTSLTPTITVSDKATVSPASGAAQDFTSLATYTVTAENQSKQDYTVTVTMAKNSAKAITKFSLGGVNGTINEDNHTIAVTVTYGTTVTGLTPTITVSEKATVSPTMAQDFTSPATYTVTAENGSTQPYTVTVTVAKNSVKSITPSTAITGLANGTAKTSAAFGLPSKVTLVADSGNIQANVSWDVASCSYDVSSSSAQTFTVSGTVTLPDGIFNTNSVSLKTNISVTVNAASGSSSGGSASSGGSSSSGSSSTTGNNSSITVTTDTGTTTATQTVSATTESNGVVTAKVTKDQIADMVKAAR